MLASSPCPAPAIPFPLNTHVHAAPISGSLHWSLLCRQAPPGSARDGCTACWLLSRCSLLSVPTCCSKQMRCWPGARCFSSEPMEGRSEPRASPPPPSPGRVGSLLCPEQKVGSQAPGTDSTCSLQRVPRPSLQALVAPSRLAARLRGSRCCGGLSTHSTWEAAVVTLYLGL